MNTKQAKKERIEAETAGQTYLRFHTFCVSSHLNEDEDTFQKWDEKHNGSKVRKTFGGDRKIFAVGLRSLYRRYLDRGSTWQIVHNDHKPPITLTAIRGDGNGNRRNIVDLNKAGREFNAAKIEREIKSSIIRARVFKMSHARIRILVEEALEVPIPTLHQASMSASASAEVAVGD